MNVLSRLAQAAFMVPAAVFLTVWTVQQAAWKAMSAQEVLPL